MSTKYATVYPFDENASDNNINNYNVYKKLITDIYGFGDGFIEYNDNNTGTYLDSPWVFFKRGMAYNYSEYTGNQREFAVDITAGVPDEKQGFRVILIKK